MNTHTTPGDIPPLDPQQMRMQRILKIVVVGLGLLILFVMGIIIYTVLGGGSEQVRTDQAPTSRAQDARPAVQDRSFGSRIVTLPEDGEVAGMAIGDGVLALQVRTPDRTPRVVLIDLATGAVSGEITLNQP
ncbi:MAG: hypothetical protein WEB93_01765 [Sphingomonadales bacterium]